MGIPGAKSSLGIKRMSSDLDEFNSTNLDIYLKAQPTNVQKAAGKKKKKELWVTLIVLLNSPFKLCILTFPWSKK